MFRLGLAQCRHSKDGDVARMIEAWVGRACDADVDLLVFPESLMTPFDGSIEEFARQAQSIDGPLSTAICEIAAKYEIWLVYTANERNENGRPFNTAVVVDAAGEKRAIYRKVHLFDTDFVHESDKVAAGSELCEPVDTPFGKLGLGICYDVRFPEQARAAALAGVDIMLYPAAWVDGPRKVEQWRTLLAARAIENELFVAGVSRCDRVEAGAARDYAGNSCVFGPLGEVVAQAQGNGEELLVADIDLKAIARARAAMPVLDHRRPDVYRWMGNELSSGMTGGSENPSATASV